ncbi:MAG: cupin domain-containing protein [Candidatus Omnitrophota bacterium]
MNVFENIPYQPDGMGKRKLVDEKHILIMQIALKPGQSVPRHSANSNVRLLALSGGVTVNLDGVENHMKKGDLLAVPYLTPMDIKNNGDIDASFLVLKTPNPSEMK